MVGLCNGRGGVQTVERVWEQGQALLEERLGLRNGQSSEQQSVGRSGLVRRSFVPLLLSWEGRGTGTRSSGPWKRCVVRTARWVLVVTDASRRLGSFP